MEKYGVNSPYDEGHQAFSAGHGLRDCPYPEGSSDEQNWKDGWYDAMEKASVDGHSGVD